MTACSSVNADDGLISPSILAAKTGSVYVSATDATGSPRSSDTVPTMGRVVLVTSPDGETWSDPMPTVAEEKAHSSALAYDDEHGLVLVYTAEREDGWPVFAARSMDDGETWGDPVMVTEPDVYAWRPDAMLHDGTLYIAYLGLPKPTSHLIDDPEGAYVLTVDPATLPVGE